MKIEVNPNSKSKNLELTNADKLKICKIEETSKSSILTNHSIIFFNELNESKQFELRQTTYDTSNYVNFYFINNNLQNSITIEYDCNLSEIEGKECKPVDDFTDNFPSSIYSYKGWQFAVTHGQGSVCSIYYKKKLMYRD